MNQAQQNALARAIQTLTALQAKFHIAMPNGDILGSPIAVPSSKKGLQGPKNADYVRKHIGKMRPGDVVEVQPQKGDTLARLQSCLTSIASRDWGKGTYTTAIEADKGVVSIFREA